MVQTSWFLRGLSYENVQHSEEELRKQLRWSDKVDGQWFDRDGVSILFYAVGIQSSPCCEVTVEESG